MGLEIVEIADCRVSADPGTEFITYSLGSCIGVAIWDPEVRVGGMLHYLLPDSALAPERVSTKPGMFANSGLPLLFRQAYRLGAAKSRLIVKVAGGAALFDTSESLNIGKRNYAALRKLFWKNNVLIDGEHVGGSISRTMRLQLATGQVSVENRKMGRIAV